MENKVGTKQATKRAFADPKVGDHFCEMACLHIFVVYRDFDFIVTCYANAPCKFPEDGKWKIYNSVLDFQQEYAYGEGTDGYWVSWWGAEKAAGEWLKTAPKDILKQINYPKEYEIEQAFKQCEDVPFGWLP